jgi:hypothetical protein
MSNRFHAGGALCLLLAFVAIPQSSRAGQAPAGELRAGQAAAAEMPAPNLAGRWELNVQASDPPRADAVSPGEGGEDRRGGGGRGGGGRGGGMGGRGGGMGGGGMGGGGSKESETAREEMRRVLEAPRVLLIVQHDATLSLTDEQGRVTSLKPDGTKIKEQSAGTTIERTTRWDGRSLVTTTKLSSGAKVTQTFTKIAEGLQLVVSTKLEGGRMGNPMEFKRVYDQAFQ